MMLLQKYPDKCVKCDKRMSTNQLNNKILMKIIVKMIKFKNIEIMVGSFLKI